LQRNDPQEGAGMTEDQDRNISDTGNAPSPAARLALTAATLGAVLYLLLADYPPVLLAAMTVLIFGAYVWMRVMLYLDNDRFSPRRIRVGMAWALVGIDPNTDEFDIRPVRIYFLLLAMLFGGLVLRPVFRWALL